MSRPAAASFSGKTAHPARVRALLLIISLLVGLVSASVLRPAPAGASLPPRTTLENSIAWAVKNLIDAERALHGLPPVHMNWHLRLSARRHDYRMALANDLTHQLPGEPPFGNRITNAGYIWNYAGENIAWNSDMSQGGVLLLEKLMYNEAPPNDDHRLNILSTHYLNVGVDVYMDNVHHKAWLTTDFAHPMG